jgi:hypothetical protein
MKIGPKIIKDFVELGYKIFIYACEEEIEF